MRMLRAGALLVLAVGVWLPDGAHAQQEYSKEGATACLECHESETIMGILETPHAKVSDSRTPAARHECESCHGPSGTHMSFPMQVGNIRFGTKKETPHKEQATACLECHNDGAREHWTASPHGFDDLTCADCHNIHKAKDPILDKAEQDKACTEACHSEVMVEAPADAPHKLGTGDYTCTDCHNPHGALSMLPCLQCHPQAEEDLAKLDPKARGYHERAIKKDIGCTSCHKGTVHPVKGLSRARVELPE